MIKIKEISKSFGDTEILHEITFEIKKGDNIAIMGSSGSGKSTLLYSISGMDSISKGSVL
ncbi:MAG: ATP-binding cassette domain-containing protein, partial [Lachnospiraceae bacterium]|nr:ATP-binding cassette domain-containing protein [Lachnospiraceae bacterium]